MGKIVSRAAAATSNAAAARGAEAVCLSLAAAASASTGVVAKANLEADLSDVIDNNRDDAVGEASDMLAEFGVR